jgi:hypothetical protein
MIWVLVGLATLLAFAHVGVRAARLVEVRQEPPPVSDGPVYETFWFKPNRITFRGKVWRQVDGYWYDEITGEQADYWGTNNSDLAAAVKEIAAGRERSARERRLKQFRA